MRWNAISHARLMKESEAQIEMAARCGPPAEALVAQRVLQQPHLYRRWEAEHDRLMEGVSRQWGRSGQIVALRSAAFGLIHRKATFEYLRDRHVTGLRRHEVFVLLYGTHDYATAVIAEHGNYLRSACSWLCSSRLGLELMGDGAFDEPFARYEKLYADYFRTFVESSLDAGPDAGSSSMRTLLPYLKRQLELHRRAILKMSERAMDADRAALCAMRRPQ